MLLYLSMGTTYTKATFHLVHSNIWGPAPLSTKRGFVQWWTDDYSHDTLYLMIHKHKWYDICLYDSNLIFLLEVKFSVVTLKENMGRISFHLVSQLPLSWRNHSPTVLTLLNKTVPLNQTLALFGHWLLHSSQVLLSFWGESLLIDAYLVYHHPSTVCLYEYPLKLLQQN